LPDQTTTPNTPTARRRWFVRGQVQGVGFRPFVYRIANEIGLRGWVRNDTSGVTIEAWAEPDALDLFQKQLIAHTPPLAQIDHIESTDLAPTKPAPTGFNIVHSESTATDRGRVTVDCATCQDCRREMLDPADRRSRHPLINCTNCGPRYSIVRDTPYDRAATTMSTFEMCTVCAREYTDPADRRFHAQPICCNRCGPKLELRFRDGSTPPGDPIRTAAELLRNGRVLAIKGIGGYHLAVDATSPAPVAELRQRK